MTISALISIINFFIVSCSLQPKAYQLVLNLPIGLLWRLKEKMGTTRLAQCLVPNKNSVNAGYYYYCCCFNKVIKSDMWSISGPLTLGVQDNHMIFSVRCLKSNWFWNRCIKHYNVGLKYKNTIHNNLPWSLKNLGCWWHQKTGQSRCRKLSVPQTWAGGGGGHSRKCEGQPAYSHTSLSGSFMSIFLAARKSVYFF